MAGKDNPNKKQLDKKKDEKKPLLKQKPKRGLPDKELIQKYEAGKIDFKFLKDIL